MGRTFQPNLLESACVGKNAQEARGAVTITYQTKRPTETLHRDRNRHELQFNEDP